MQNLFSALHFSSWETLVFVCIVFGGVSLVIVSDVKGKGRERLSGLQRSWYQRPSRLFCLLMVVFGFMALVDSRVFFLPSFLTSSITTLGSLLLLGIGLWLCALLLRQASKSSPLPTAPLSATSPLTGTRAVPVNPLLIGAWLSCVAGVFSLTIILGVTIMQYLHLFQVMQNPIGEIYRWLFLVLELALVFVLVRSVSRLRFLHRIEHRRHSLAVSEHVEAVAVQPGSIFRFPLVLTLRFKRGHLCVLVGLLLGFLAPGLIDLVPSFFDEGSVLSASWWFSLAYFLLFLLAILAVALVPLFFLRDSVEATENGLKSRSGALMEWQDAHLFVCYTIPDLFLSHRSVTHYELSGSQGIIVWKWVHDTRSLFTPWEPWPEAREYQRKMQELCKLVKERTGLPCYDLSQTVQVKPSSDEKMQYQTLTQE